MIEDIGALSRCLLEGKDYHDIGVAFYNVKQKCICRPKGLQMPMLADTRRHAQRCGLPARRWPNLHFWHSLGKSWLWLKMQLEPSYRRHCRLAS